MSCEVCLKEINDGALFCRFCGAKQNHSHLEDNKAQSDSSSPFWGIVIILLILGSVFGYVYYLHSQGQCLVIGARGTTSNMTCDGMEDPFTNFVYVVGMFVFLIVVRSVFSVFTPSEKK